MGKEEKTTPVKQPETPKTTSVEVDFDGMQIALDRRFKDLKQLREEKYALIDVTNNEIKGIDIELNKLSGEFRMIDRLRAQQTKSKTVEAAGEVKTEEKKDGNEGGQ